MAMASGNPYETRYLVPRTAMRPAGELYGSKPANPATPISTSVEPLRR
jgi:hypothetical protein